MTRTKERIRTIFFAMGTVCSITVYSPEHKKAVSAAKKRVLDLHSKFNAYDPQSEVSHINRNAGVRFTEVSGNTRFLIERSVGFSKLTDGVFDITTTPISQLWKDGIKAQILPIEIERAKAAALVDYRDILIENDAVMLKRKGQQIDLGAIAKGFAADEVRRILSECGVYNALINLGGTVVVMGEKQTVGIQNPFEKTGTAFASVQIQNKAVVSSGLYEQGFTQNGKTFHHIIDPRTGFPSDSDLAGITLIGDNAELLDAWSTTAFILPISQATELLKRFQTEAIFVTKDGRVFVTVDSTGDNPEFFSKAKQAVIPAIISGQSIDVDTVSGATFSSQAIINAVANALGDRLVVPTTQPQTMQPSPTVPTTTQAPTEAPTEEETEAETEAPTEAETAEETQEAPQNNNGFTDGVYSGSGTGLRGTTTVEVTVQNGSITDITVTSYQDDEKFFNRAQSSVISAILSAQSTDVDTVSGATYSSNSIIEAVANALGL